MNKKKTLIIAGIAFLILLIIILISVFSGKNKNDPTKVLNTYFSYLQNRRIWKDVWVNWWKH